MKSYSSPYLVICNGYNTQDYECLRDHLILTGLFTVIREDDAGDAKNHGDKDADIVLIGVIATSEEISNSIKKFRTDFPEAIIIRCIPHTTPDSGRSSFRSLVDGYFLFDLNSPSWGDNLVGIIWQALIFRNKLRSPDKIGDDIYQQIFENNAIPMTLSIPETGMFVEVNKSFTETYGYQREEIIGKSPFDLKIFVTKPECDEDTKEGIKQNAYRDREVSIQTKDNRIMTCLLSADIITRNGKELYLTTMKDISFLKRIETELKNKNQFIKDILSSVNEGIAVYNTVKGYRVWNRYLENLTGIPATDVMGKLTNFLPFDLNESIQPHIDKAIQGGSSTSEDIFFDIQSTRKTGWISLLFSPLRDSSGKIPGVIISVRDISERKKTETEIITQKLLLRSIIDTVPVRIGCIDMDGKIILTNTAFSSIFGFSPDMIEGCYYEDLLFSPRFKHHIPLIKRALSGKIAIFDEEMKDPESKYYKKYFRGRYTPLRDTNGKLNGVVCVIIDITDLIIAQNTIESINSKLNLLSSITRHDILNSLTGVLGYLTCAADEEDSDLLRTYIEKASKTALLIQEQIEFTRDYQDLGVKEPVWQYTKTIFTIATRSLKLGDILVEPSLDDLHVFADPLLERVIYNLVDNALRYGKKVTRISSYWYRKDDQAIWVIEDNGIGISNEMKERIFRKGVGHHTGLGLFLAREILDITGLSISETGTEGEGARFEILIPNGLWKNTGDT